MKSGKPRLFDFGLARIYVDKKMNFIPNNQKYIKNEMDIKPEEIIGNIAFSSKYNCLGSLLYPRDDVISLAYILLFMFDYETLPWIKYLSIQDLRKRCFKIYKLVC